MTGDDVDSVIREGSTVFVRTVTHNFIGTIHRVVETHEGVPVLIALNPAAWVAETGVSLGRFLSNGITGATEVEVYPSGCVVGCGALIDVSPWLHAVPTVSQ
jgi:hypothetical protein